MSEMKLAYVVEFGSGQYRRVHSVHLNAEHAIVILKHGSENTNFKEQGGGRVLTFNLETGDRVAETRMWGRDDQ